MEISVVGISHRTSPVSVREQFALGPDGAREMLRGVSAEGIFSEVVVLDTCNRVEAYLVSRQRRDVLDDFLRHVCRLKGVPKPADTSGFYRHDGRDAVHHLFRVAASLESQIVGEHQILGQLKDAYQLAVQERTPRFLLNRLLHSAFRTGKRVQTETQLGRGAASVPMATIELAGTVFSTLAGKTVLFVGAGQTPQLAARALLRRGVRRLIVANRTLARAQQVARELMVHANAKGGEDDDDQAQDHEVRCPVLLALQVGSDAVSAPVPPASAGVAIEAVTLEEIPSVIAQADLVICATNSPEPILTCGNVGEKLRQAGHPLLLFDISVPRNVEEGLAGGSNVFLYTLDDLNCLIARNLQRRGQEILQAQAIVNDEVQRFTQWLDCLELGPTIELLIKHFDAIQQAEIERYGHKVSADREQLRRFTRSLCQKVLHGPLAFLQEVTKNDPDGESLAAVDMIRRMFGLDSMERSMIGISKLYCGTVESSDVLRYGARSARLPSHLLQFSADKKPVVVWNCTRQCNLRCVHCYAAAGACRDEGEMTTDEGLAMLDDLAAFGVPVLLLSGGEPIMRQDIFQLARRAVSLGMRAVISTNGTLIDQATAGRLAEVQLSYVGVSLDGMRDVNDRFRGSRGAFDAALAGIRNCRKAGLKVGLRFTINTHNVGEIDGIFSLLAEEDIPRVCFYHLVYAGRGAALMKADLDADATRRAVDLIIDRTAELHRQGLAKEVLTVDNHADGPYLYLRMLREGNPRAGEVLKLLRMNAGNSSGVGIGCVSWDGAVHADQFWRHESFGNVRHRRFSDIWTDLSNPLMARLKDKRRYVKGRRSTCRFLDVCGGNFRVRAEAATGDLWAPDPACYLRDEEIEDRV